MTLWQRFVRNVRLRRFVVLAVIIFVLWLLRGEMNTILLTFIFTFLMLRLIHWIHKYVNIPSWLIVLLVYAGVIALAYIAVTTYLPKLIDSSLSTANELYRFYENPHNDANGMMTWLSSYLNSSDLLGQLKGGATVVLKYLTTIGSFGVTLFISMMLSFFFTIEEKQMAQFSELFLVSDFDWFFQDIYYFAVRFVETFGVVLEAQFFIAICNTVITTIILAFMGMPQLATLAIMIFILSLIPVAGVIVSVIPLSLVGYSVGGWKYVIYILVMIVLVHFLEAYVLNPKFMSSRTQLPTFYTLVVLILGDWLFGVWGLIVGVPIFTFFLDILGVKPIGNSYPRVDIQKLRERTKRYKKSEDHDSVE
ncbi:AI-2E family transporter [Levilactobacillus bambusae]|uniref:AI-2E family transporter n=1 Tax=Levilactobacillus bambusae TaxID=2024736 RepID=A0A2V1MXE7_9LACO|nr:AI-2E family transporter [Levilactobacillus bambusae]PWF99730.1 AI-2E family transporter [Levilactobacillus bambusae]